MVIKENSPKLPLPRTIQRTHLGAWQSNDRLPTQKRPKFQQLSSKYQKTINALSSQTNQLRIESIKSQLSWNFSRNLDQGMNKRHKSTTVPKRGKKQPRRIIYFKYDERLLPSTRSIYAPNSFKQHLDKINHVELRYASNRTTPELKNPYLQSKKQDSRFSDKITEPKQIHHPSSFPRNKTKTNANKQKWKK